MIGIAGGCGGVGASTLAAALACSAAARAVPTAVVDADPLGGGLDLLFGAEDIPGARWSQIGLLAGATGPPALQDRLPRAAGVWLVSFSRDGAVQPEAADLAAVLTALGAWCQLVVVDLGRPAMATGQSLLPFVDLVLLVTRARLRAVAASRAALASLGPSPRGLVVRDADRWGINAAEVSRALDIELVGTLRSERWLELAAERGLAPVPSGDGAMARLCAALLTAARAGAQDRAD